MRSFAHAPACSFAPSLLRSFAPSLLRSFAPSLLRSFAPSLLRSFAPSLFRSLFHYFDPVRFNIFFCMLVYPFNLIVNPHDLYRSSSRMVCNFSCRAGVKGMIVLLPLLGLTWVFGLLAINKDTIAFQYLFAILNSLQVRNLRPSNTGSSLGKESSFLVPFRGESASNCF